MIKQLKQDENMHEQAIQLSADDVGFVNLHRLKNSLPILIYVNNIMRHEQPYDQRILKQ